jgi:hypothetical protein
MVTFTANIQDPVLTVSFMVWGKYLMLLFKVYNQGNILGYCFNITFNDMV